ncbi:lysophospholipid acyltransferase family protein [Mycobacterium sp. 1274761.0]|uniref:lysophospholipid acyltransferase family protein n=1 Tax=Mycobacterium sp. 1274761.0 TaxID=1834077 RepID=UPI0007FC83FD|nr:lysophospholipid acyltransferase family protein [Mycobacterium sp. 1274761.0]OBK77705.1 glycerol acyltransferase [Mycobacterium sp. 1274761.0]
MGDKDGNSTDRDESAKWDPVFTEQIKNWVGPLVKRYFRSEVRGLEAIPPAGGALLVSNHSGGMLTPDVLVFVPAFYEKFGFDRPVFTLAHSAIFVGPMGQWLHRAGVIEANRENAEKVLRAGALVLVFPGGDYDSYRPTFENKIDFAGRKGYVRTAIESGVPIVPMVSIGAQETQLFLTRGNWLAKRLGLRRLRAEILPVSVGFPFGLSVFFPPNIPLPTKVVTQVLEPIDVVKQFGEDPDVDAVDAHVREVMQTALDELAKQRRFPILG